MYIHGRKRPRGNWVERKSSKRVRPENLIPLSEDEKKRLLDLNLGKTGELGENKPYIKAFLESPDSCLSYEELLVISDKLDNSMRDEKENRLAYRISSMSASVRYRATRAGLPAIHIISTAGHGNKSWQWILGKKKS